MSYLEGWSFCIVSTKGNENILRAVIGSINAQVGAGDNYEIVVVGDCELEPLPHVVNVDFRKRYFGFPTRSSLIRGWKNKSLLSIFERLGPICHKKNLAAKSAKYDKLCIMHDYLLLNNDWISSFREFGDNWQVCSTQILNEDGSRFRDWCSWDNPLVGPAMLPYESYSRYMYISGSFFCVKKQFFLSNLLSEKLFWGEGEDIEWSKRVREKTKFRLNPKAKVKSTKNKPICDSWVRSSALAQKLYDEGRLD